MRANNRHAEATSGMNLLKAIPRTELSTLDLLSRGRLDIEQAKTVQNLKGIRDKAEAVRQYAKQVGESLAVQNACAEIKLRAERKAGELLNGMDRPAQGRPSRRSKYGSIVEPLPKLADLGIDKKESHRWQREAEVPEPNFKKWVTAQNEAKEEVTQAGLIRIARQNAREERIDAIRRRGERESQTEAPGLVNRLEDVIGRYRTVYLDPPWKYDNAGCRGAAENHYETMSIEELEALPVGAIVHPEGGHVWCWLTWPMMRDGNHERLFRAWGLEWKSEIVWHKLGRMGMGNWARVETELLLLGVKGECPRLVENVRGFVESPIGEHSEKPLELYDSIERFSPGPRIELFARRGCAGWDRWGKEAGSWLEKQGAQA